MPAAGVLGSIAQCTADVHPCIHGIHVVQGGAISGAARTNIGSMPALRVGDNGTHSVCCGPQTWQAFAGSSTVKIEGKAAHRKGDATKHCGGMGTLITNCCETVIIGG